MTNQEALEYIHSAQKFGIKPGLERILELLKRMGNPQKGQKFIHVAGTNGKGSICNMTANILKEAGYKTGLFISPYIEEFNERISVNGENISGNSLRACIQKIKRHIDAMVSDGFEHPTEFEIITAAAFDFFKKQGCDFVVLEAGLGGRLDSTNVIESPVLSVITSVSFDHMDVLGDTIEEIAYEKCGIIKRGCPVVLYPVQPEQVYVMVAKTADKYDCPAYIPYVSEIEIQDSTLLGTKFTYGDIEIELNLGGVHQIYNCATVIEVINVLNNGGAKITQKNIYDGVLKTKVPGRLEVLKNSPLVIADGAHNYSGVSALCKAIDTFLAGKKIIAVMGMLKDKQYNECITEVAKRAHEFIGVNPANPRALDARDACRIAEEFTKASAFENIDDALEYALDKCEGDGVIIICGSLYLIGGVRQFFVRSF